MKKRVLLKDIADKLNLSINTVSKALKDKQDISFKTRELVKKTAEELGYVPDFVASSMRTVSTKTIAVLFDNLLNPYFMIMASSIQRQLREIGYDMMIFTTTGTEALLTMETLKQMIRRRVDGVISFLRPDKPTSEYANKMHVPVFVVGREADDLNIDSIYTDDFSGGYKMAEYLYNKGCRNVGYLGGPVQILCNVKRAEGFTQFYKEKGIDTIVYYNNWDDYLIYPKIDGFIKNNIDAIFCFNDNIAYDTILYLNKKYPDHKDILVAGYDNIANNLLLPISIPTIGTDIEKMISICIEQLMKRIADFDIPLFVHCIDTFLDK
jgi:LacI family transcriptional regulator